MRATIVRHGTAECREYTVHEEITLVNFLNEYFEGTRPKYFNGCATPVDVLTVIDRFKNGGLLPEKLAVRPIGDNG